MLKFCKILKFNKFFWNSQFHMNTTLTIELFVNHLHKRLLVLISTYIERCFIVGPCCCQIQIIITSLKIGEEYCSRKHVCYCEQ